ncbi:MAG TPA: sigma-70 family RNA polymerase sigma factor [Gemmataceae bacterium]|nr:sigma-70 family RNA polymerase sigma factor [Gemmataceae bacterium]
MTSDPLTRLVQSLRTSLDTDSLSDADLLTRLRMDRDPAAMEAIVRRHGPKVLAACRKVLGPDAEAEDAFQATFLVLMRNPSAVRQRASLGAWLYGVAHRISLQARARRQRHMRLEANAPAKREPGADLPWREACAILHEELDRLPDTSRLPLVLCYLDGLSRDEAAQQLGRTLHSVKKSLETGRATLRKRLARRGVTLSTGLLAAVAEPAAAEPPLDLARAAVEGTIRPSAAVAALARSAVRPTFPVRSVAVVCLSATVLSVCTALGQMPTSTDPPPKAPTAAPVAKDDRAPKDQPAKAPAAEPAGREPAPVAKTREPAPDSFNYRGRAVTLDGKPVKDAQVYLHVNSLKPRPFIARARTDGDGRFSFDVKRSELDPHGYDLSATPWANGHLIGSAPGLGVAWTRDLTPGQDAELLFIADDVPIEGRVLNLEGRPVAGAKVRVLWVFHPIGGNLDRWLDAARGMRDLNDTWKALHGLEAVSYRSVFLLYPLRRHGFDPAVPAVTTGSDGRFTVRGIGRDRVAMIQVEGEGIENRPTVVVSRVTDPFVVASFTLDTIGGSSRTFSGPPTDTVHGAKFDLAVGPDRPVVGVVTDWDTAKPVAGAVVTFQADAYGIWDRHRARATTAADGRFRLTGLPMRDDCTLRVEPPTDQPYFPITLHVRPRPALGPIELNPKLKRGIWLTGKVIDRDSKVPLRANYQYGAAPDNSHLPPNGVLTYEFRQFNRADDGTFRTPILPGRGYLGVTLEPPADKLYERGQGVASDRMDETIRTEPNTISGNSMHSLPRLDVPADATEVKLEFPITPGRSAEVAVRGPGGEQLRGVVITAEPNGPRSEKLGADGNFWVRPRQFIQAVCPASKLAGRLQVMGTEKGPVTLTLEPWRTATGRVLDAAGKPVAGAVLSFGSGETRPEESEPEGFWHSGQPVCTDKNGVFRIEGLVPGSSYTMLIWAKGRPGQALTFRADWNADEVKELGDLKPPRE